MGEYWFTVAIAGRLAVLLVRLTCVLTLFSFSKKVKMGAMFFGITGLFLLLIRKEGYIGCIKKTKYNPLNDTTPQVLFHLRNLGDHFLVAIT